MRVALYARVSTDGQSVDTQVAELTAAAQRNGWTIVAVHIDQGISGTKGREKRPGYDDLWKQVTRREIDMVAAWAVDRLGRSLINLLHFLKELQAKNVALYLHRNGIDTSTPAGMMVFQMLGIFAEFERAIISERTKASLARRKAAGMRLGQVPIAVEVRDQIAAMRDRGMSRRQTALALKISPHTAAAYWGHVACTTTTRSTDSPQLGSVN